MSLSSRTSRTLLAAGIAVAVFLTLTFAIHLKDSPSRGTAKASVTAGQPAATDVTVDKRHEAMALESELEKKPNHVPILFRLAQLARDNGNHAEAVTHLRKIVQLEPNNTEARLELGRNLYDAGEVTAALTETNKILTEDPKNVDALYNMGAIYANSNKPDAAREFWKRAVASAPDSESGKQASQGLARLAPVAR